MRSLGIDVGGTSTKMALLEAGKVVWTGQSAFYSKPDPKQLTLALQQAAAGRVSEVDTCGICVPGILNDERTMVTLSVNVPGLMGLPLTTLVSHAFGDGVPAVRVCNDAISCATDAIVALKLLGRTMVLAMGTGVGAAVIDRATENDAGIALLVDGESPGHLGMLDVSIGDNPPLGPDGGAGGLEGYIGVPALRRDYGDDVNGALSRLTDKDACLKALARAIRIGHALYRPHHVVLAGGIGTRLAPKLDIIKGHVEKNLTSVARKERTLQCAANDFHAACGAARLSARG
jgi:predicted NBD/HSP70 family sugar kinase